MTKKPIIAVDIDEVLAVHNEALVSFHNSKYGTSHTLADYVTEHWSEIWGVSQEQAARRAMEFHETGAHATFEVINGAAEVLKYLSGDYDFVAVTVRRKITIQWTHQWLDRHFPGVFAGVRFIHAWEDPDTPSKADVCREIGADWLIDDSLKHCTVAAEAGLVGLLFGDYPWNQSPGSLPKGVLRVKDWQAVREYFDGKRS